MTAEEPAAALRDRITELTEENARLAEAVAARDAFLAVAAHELRNPMTPIIGRIAMLRRAVRNGSLGPDRIGQRLDQIEWLSILFMKRATTLLDVSRMTSGKLRLDLIEVDVREVARTVVETFRPLADHARSGLELDLPAAGLTVLGDRLSLEQVLDNLVSNAIKYGGGRPILVSATADPANALVRIGVRDGGPGIPADSQARIFERFERAVRPGEKAGGFGIGLWIVRQLCEAMAGTVEVVSAPGEGSTFRISLPMPPA